MINTLSSIHTADAGLDERKLTRATRVNILTKNSEECYASGERFARNFPNGFRRLIRGAVR